MNIIKKNHSIPYIASQYIELQW